MRDVVRKTAPFPELLTKLEALVERETGRTGEARAALASGIRQAVFIYNGTKFAVELASQSTFHEIAEPLARVIALLEAEANRDAILTALGAPEWLAMGGRFSVDGTGAAGPPIATEDEQHAEARYRALLDGLHAIARAVPAPPTKRKRGKPPTAKDFVALVDRLATCWERATGKRFTQDWHKGEPVSAAARFVHAVVKLVDPARLRSLPKAAAQVVAERIEQAF
jgi:hypothetical protein